MKGRILILVHIFLCFISIFADSGVRICPKYVCKDANGDICYSVKNLGEQPTYEFSICKEAQVCDLHFGTADDKCAPYYTTPFRYPGEYAYSEKECLSGLWNGDENRTCIGKSEDAPCTQDYECDVNLYCFKEKCTQTLNESEACGDGQKCGVAYVCSNKFCEKIGGKKVGESASVPSACETFYVSGGVCSPGPTLDRAPEDLPKVPILCKENHCKYTLNNQPIVESCKCGKTENGDSFCMPGVGDFDMTDVR